LARILLTHTPEALAQAGEILKGRAPKSAVNTRHWTRKELLEP